RCCRVRGRGKNFLLAVVVAVPLAAAAVVTQLPGDAGTDRRRIDAPPSESHKYASQTSSRARSRAAHKRWSNLEQSDSASEICEGRSTEDWARLLGVRPDPRVVAR